MVRLTGLIALLSTVLGIALRAISIIWVTLKQVENRAKNACRFFISRMRTHTRVFYFARVRVGSNRGKIRQFPIIIHWPADQFSNKTQILNSQFPIPNSQLLVSNSWDKCRQIASTIAASAGELRAFIRANLIYRLGAPKVRQFGVRGVHQRQARLHLSTPAKLIGVLTVFLVSTLAGFIIQFTDQTPKPAYAAINEQLNFQARLYNASGGIASDGNYNLQFHIYSGGDGDPDTADETLEWTGSYLKGNTDGVDVANGYFNVQLGDSVSQVNTMADVDWDNSTLWLSINIGDTSSTGTTTCDTESEFDSNCGGDGEMDPFLRLTSVPYAFNSKYLGGRSSSQFAQLDPSSQQTGSIDISGTVNAAALNRTGGNLTLQTTTSGNIVINGAGTLDVQDAATFASTIGVTGTATFNGDVDLVLADTENLSVSNTVTGTNGVDLVSTVLTNNTTSGTQRIAVLQNAAGSGTTEALLVLDNADADTAVTTGLQVTSAAGTIGTAIDISDTEIGTGISLVKSKHRYLILPQPLL
ncbi:hypothetical protein DYH10_02030 [Candidatus Saccharibacteria bacterium CPR2]|nr:hypothetical protein [Candidatus Saccharibacteria bacterium CPR2]